MPVQEWDEEESSSAEATEDKGEGDKE